MSNDLAGVTTKVICELAIRLDDAGRNGAAEALREAARRESDGSADAEFYLSAAAALVELSRHLAEEAAAQRAK